MRRVLVTGGAGFLGSHLVRRLLREHRGPVVVLDNLYRGHREALAGCLNQVRFIEGDVRDPDTLLEALDGIEIVYHLAAQSSVIRAENDPNYTFHTNVAGTFHLLEAAKLNQVKRVVFASSREVYGDPVLLPVSEQAPLNPKNAYGASKAAAESYCSLYDMGGLETAILRLANVYGPGDCDRVIPRFVENALENRPIVLFGGQQVLDFVWIDAVVDALFQAGFGERFVDPINIGSGTGTRISCLVQRIIELTGSQSEIRVAPCRDTETKRFVADVDRAKQVFGLQPPQDPLFGLADVVGWTRSSIGVSQAAASG